jgi:membrane protease YdiL (CAAX protease family)
MTIMAALRGPAPYVPRSNWPAWAVLPAGVVIFILAALLGAALSLGYGALSGAQMPTAIDPSRPEPQTMVQIALWIAGLQSGIIILTWIAAGFFGTPRAEALALRRPAGGWGVLPLALIPLFVGTMVWTAVLVQWKPDAVVDDLRPFQQLLQGDARYLMMAIICVGAPVSEEFLFRGFLFSGIARTRLGFVGTAILTTLLWTALHAGYSVFGLVEVLGIGLYFSWLLVRTGSLWVTIFCHAVYNTAIAIALFYVVLPAAAG